MRRIFLQVQRAQFVGKCFEDILDTCEPVLNPIDLSFTVAYLETGVAEASWRMQTYYSSEM